MSRAVLDFVNVILRWKHAILHDSDEGGHRFADDPAVFCTLAISRVHYASKSALRAVKEVGLVAQFAPLIEQAYSEFVRFCKEGEMMPVGTAGRVQRLLSSEAWQRLRTALDQIAFYLPLLQDESSDGESIADQLDRGDLLLLKVRVPAERNGKRAAEHGEPTAQGRPSARGRKIETDVDEDRRIFEAWQTGCYRTKKDLARELGKPADHVKAAIERHRQRARCQTLALEKMA